MNAAQNNPLLEVSSLDFEAVPFDRIREEHFEPAFAEALARARKAVEAIKNDPAPADFANTVERLEACDEDLDHVGNVFGNLLSAHTSENLQKMAKVFLPELAKFSNDLFLDPQLYRRVKEVHDKRDSLGLSGEQRMLLDKLYKSFVRNGAELDDDKKGRLRQIDEKLAVLSQSFSDNVLKATNDFEMFLTSEEDLEGLPGWFREGAKAAAREKGRDDAWLITLQFPSLGPFLKYSERRDLREKVWRAYTSRAASGETDNRETIKEIAALRFERANLLGFETHAHFVLEERMASDPRTVYGFLDRLKEVSRQAAEKDLEELREFAGGGEIKPWDTAFLSERLKKKKYDFDEEVLRPYFRLEKVIDGVFEHARRLYGLTFKRREDLPAYHEDVYVYEVWSERDGSFVGLFYADFFPRASKRGGAWMTTYRSQGLSRGEVKRPHVSIVCNFSKPTGDEPSLLNLMEVRTLFHEFGHGLHALLSKCRYKTLSGTSVYWDFVELPSQIMENWVREKESLALFARHYRSGEVIPDEYVDKIRESSRFQTGLFSLRQLNFGYLDLSWHAHDPRGIDDVEKHEVEATRETTLLPHEPGSMISPSFGHIFAGGYSAGYYSYKWAEVLDADAFELFQEKGLFSREAADRFRENILERGGTEHPAELYKRFRGREPDPDALLRRDGMHPTGLPEEETAGAPA